MDIKTICVIGAGNGGSAIAGDMALAGHRCRLFEFPEYQANIEPIQAQGGIRVTGIARTGFARLELATTDLAEAIEGADLIMIATVCLGRGAGIPTPTYDCMIRLASVVNETDFFSPGRNLENLDLAHLTPAQLERYLQTGQKP